MMRRKPGRDTLALLDAVCDCLEFDIGFMTSAADALRRRFYARMDGAENAGGEDEKNTPEDDSRPPPRPSS